MNIFQYINQLTKSKLIQLLTRREETEIYGQDIRLIPEQDLGKAYLSILMGTFEPRDFIQEVII